MIPRKFKVGDIVQFVDRVFVDPSYVPYYDEYSGLEFKVLAHPYPGHISVEHNPRPGYEPKVFGDEDRRVFMCHEDDVEAIDG
jgi:hypothetical protein